MTLRTETLHEYPGATQLIQRLRRTRCNRCSLFIESRLVDVGETTWDALEEVPVVTVLPEGARSGPVPARQGHMYVPHTRNDVSDLHSVFRVDWLEPGDRCAISWANVPSPEASAPDRGPN